MGIDADYESTQRLGDEYDDALRARVVDVLRKLGAIPLGRSEKFVVGSQDLEMLDVVIGGRNLRIEAETYIGLTISGPSDLVDAVVENLAISTS